MEDRFDLQRFVAAQEGSYAQALRELQAGAKRSHWMWFIFPQVTGLGSSAMARRYAIRGLDEARAYLGHPVLGARLRACTDAVLGVSGRSVQAIFGSPDDLKFRSSMTLFAQARPADGRFRQALERYFDGADDPHTLARLRETPVEG